ncbi:MAG: hypothetical protein IJV15_07830 [Lachnospiraceae bacterium]|nr:hypothetical protein [Lachnospiraceae bacterium]
MKKFFSNNRGSAVVEATLIIPLFLFAMLTIYSMCQCKLTEETIYEAAAETVEYMAEYSYISDNTMYLAQLKMQEYIDDKELVERYVSGGIGGLSYLGTIPRDGEDYVILRVNYSLNIDIPFMPKLSKKRYIVVRQRAYIGESDEAKTEKSDYDKYVYVTDNRDVYHESRACTHLNLSVHTSSDTYAKANGYTACEFCGEQSGDLVYITDEGRRYHYNKNCSGLKRSIYRVRLSETGGLGGCQRCTD